MIGWGVIYPPLTSRFPVSLCRKPLTASRFTLGLATASRPFAATPGWSDQNATVAGRWVKPSALNIASGFILTKPAR